MSRCGIFYLVCILAGCQITYAIRNGARTKIEKHPYQVAIDNMTQPAEGGGVSFNMICTGALLTTKTVVTAARCSGHFKGVLNVTTVRVRVGSQFREAGGEAFSVADYLSHPTYRKWDGENDVMLLFLQEEVALRAAVQVVPLVGPAKGVGTGEKLIMTGYGDQETMEVVPEGAVRELRATTLSAFSEEMCDWLYNFHHAWRNRGCAGGVNSGVCGKTDIGAPLVNWRGELVGVATQLLVSCETQGRPTVFTNFAVVALNEWVSDNMNGKPPVQTTTDDSTSKTTDPTITTDDSTPTTTDPTITTDDSTPTTTDPTITTDDSTPTTTDPTSTTDDSTPTTTNPTITTDDSTATTTDPTSTTDDSTPTTTDPTITTDDSTPTTTDPTMQ